MYTVREISRKERIIGRYRVDRSIVVQK